MKLDTTELLSRNKLERLLHYGREDLKSFADRAATLYRPFDTLAARKRKWRHIDNPTEGLRKLQRVIARRLFREFEFPPGMVGGVRGKRLTDAAEPHVGQRWVLSLDLKDCFHRVSDEAVYRALVRHRLCGHHVAQLITEISTLHHRLPQGAPTSSALANLSLIDMHAEIRRLCQREGLRYTIFVDDISVSGNRAREVAGEIIDIVERHGHAVGARKKQLAGANRHQAVLGLGTNRKLSIPHERLSKLFDDIMGCLDLADIKRSRLQSLEGRVRSIQDVDPKQGERFRHYLLENTPEIVIEDEPVKLRRDLYRECPGHEQPHGATDEERVRAAEADSRYRELISSFGSSGPSSARSSR